MTTRVVVLDDDDDLRETITEILGMAAGAECVPAGSVAELKEHANEALGTELALIDINLGAGQPSGLDAYEWLQQSGYLGQVVFLTGHASSHPLVDEAQRLGNARVLTKPVAFEALSELVRGAA